MMMVHGPVPQNFLPLSPRTPTQPDQVPPLTTFFLSLLPARAVCQPDCAQSTQPPTGFGGKLILRLPRAALCCSTQSPAESPSLLPAAATRPHGFLIQPEREEHVMQTRCEHNEATPFLPHTKKAHWGTLCNIESNQHVVNVLVGSLPKGLTLSWACSVQLREKQQVCGLEEIVTFSSFAKMVVAPIIAMCKLMYYYMPYHSVHCGIECM